MSATAQRGETTSRVEHLTKSETADLLRVSLDTVERYVRRGLLPAYRLPGGHPRFRREDVAALLAPADGAGQ